MSETYLNLFKKNRNFVTDHLRDEKKLYYSNQFNSTQGRTENVWKALNSMLSIAPEAVTKIVKDGIEIQGPDLADAFNDFFLSVGGTTTSSIALRYMNNWSNQTILLEPVSESELVATFLTLINSKAADAGNIQMKPVKYVIDILAPCLTYIFNICLSTGHFPRNMQTAKVTVIYKKGPRNDTSNSYIDSTCVLEGFGENKFETPDFFYWQVQHSMASEKMNLLSLCYRHKRNTF